MSFYLSNLSRTIKIYSLYASTAMTAGTFLGAILFFLYCININTFPQHLSLADTLLFLLVFICFSFAYALFVGSMLALGIIYSLILRPLLNPILLCIARIFCKENCAPAYSLARFSWAAVPFAVYAPLFIFLFTSGGFFFYAAILVAPIAYYISYSTLISSAAKMKRSRGESREKEGDFASTNNQKHKGAFVASALMIMLLPLIFPLSPFLDGTMRMAQLRVDRSIIYTKEPYSSLIPKALIAEEVSRMPPGYRAYKDVTVLLRNVGSTVAIEFHDKEEVLQRIDIPNESIIIKHPRR